jgi:(p)ppGpp synthase/HD superfamily hydrolase
LIYIKKELKASFYGGDRMLEKAIIIAASAHQDQVDKGGNPYILHPLAVMLSLEDEIERICAVLHDVIEDTDITLEYLKNEGFSSEVLTALDALSRRKDESYDEFIDRIIKNKITCHVKLADLKHNMDLSRIKQPSQKDYDRIKKYQKEVKALSKK